MPRFDVTITETSLFTLEAPTAKAAEDRALAAYRRPARGEVSDGHVRAAAVPAKFQDPELAELAARLDAVDPLRPRNP